MGVGLAIAVRSPRAVSRCHSATSLPTPSPSAFTWVVRATRRPGASTAATSRAALLRSGGMETPFVDMPQDKREGVPRMRRSLPRPDERHEVRARPRDTQGPAYREAVLLQQEPT